MDKKFRLFAVFVFPFIFLFGLTGCGENIDFHYPEQEVALETGPLRFDIGSESSNFRELIYPLDPFDPEYGTFHGFVKHVQIWKGEDCILKPSSEIEELMERQFLDESQEERLLELEYQYRLKALWYKKICGWLDAFSVNPPQVEFEDKPHTLLESYTSGFGSCPIRYEVYVTNWGRTVRFNDCVILRFIQAWMNVDGKTKLPPLELPIITLVKLNPLFSDPLLDEVVGVYSFLNFGFRNQ